MSSPSVVRTVDELRSVLPTGLRARGPVGLVPTMGALHAGHEALLAAARKSCRTVVMSLFVNPAQFGEAADLEAYPRDEERDLEIAGRHGVDVVYAPAAEHVYPQGFATSVEVAGELVDALCGAEDQRGRAHFRGVTTVVAKLLNSVGPDVAFFGQKDAQQAAVIRRMVADLDIPVEIAVVPTVREPDGLAMSSRNAHLTPAERRRAAALHRALSASGAALERETASLAEALAAAREILREAGIEPEYLEVRDAETLAALESLNGRPALLAVAARVGRARLIDNVVIGPRDGSPAG